MLTTARSLYDTFLDGIKKEYTGTVTPAVFERIWNIWAQPEWLKNSVSSDEGFEINQKKIDDLAVLFNRWFFASVNLVNKDIYPLPNGTNGIDVYIDSVLTTIPLPRYYRSTQVGFILDYDTSSDQECELTGKSEVQIAYFMRSDQKRINYFNPYRQPKDSRLYWQRRNIPTLIQNPAYPSDTTKKVISGYTDSIQMLTDKNKGSNSYAMYLEYLTYPNDIAITPTDVPSVLSENPKNEIVKLCVQMYLERVRDPRYQSFLMEQKLQKQNQS